MRPYCQPSRRTDEMGQAGLSGLHSALVYSIAITDQQPCPILDQLGKRFFGEVPMDQGESDPFTRHHPEPLQDIPTEAGGFINIVWGLDVHFINTLPVPTASCHSRESGNPGGERYGDWMPAGAGMTFYWCCTYSRCLFHKSTASSPGLSLGAPRSSVASGAGLEPGAPRGGHWYRTCEMDI